MEIVEDSGAAHRHGYIHRKDDYLTRLRRIEGQARGLQRMVEDEKYCIDILTQVSAMTKALQSVAHGQHEEHQSHSVVEAARTAVSSTGASLVTVRPPVSRSTSTPVTPGTCETSSVTALTQWPQVMPVTV
jgi:DNA-binding FrmR family transcriptional regulator